MAMTYPTVELRLPDWVQSFAPPGRVYKAIEDRMALAISLAQRNIDEGTGGPFGAAVFEKESGALIAPGVNVVVRGKCSLAHAESMALMVAQQVLQTFDLGANGLPELELVTSGQPCIQCYGNTWWSGVRRLVIGARAEDVERLTGLLEGPLPADWVARLEGRSTPLKSVEVVRDVLRARACEVLEYDKLLGGEIYNSGSTSVGQRNK